MNMNTMKKKVISLAMLLTVMAVAVPFCRFTSVNAASASLSGSSYTSSTVLAKKLDKVFAGNIGLYKNSGCTKSYQAKFGSTGLNGSNRLYIRNNTTGSVTYGWQCYIYANAVYNTLYNEYVGRGSGLSHSKVVLKGGKTVSYDRFVKAGVKCGAYVRSTKNSDGSYNGSQGHSFVVISYNKNTVTYVEGNADGRGLVRMTTKTWSELNKAQFSGRGRYLCHVVQPTDSYYNKLVGTSSGNSSSTTVKAAQKTTTTTTAKSTVSATPNPGKVSFSRTLSYNSKSVMTGSDVKYMQTCLKAAGYSLTVNGKFDSATSAAVKKFQKANGLTADGKIGKKTWPLIEKAATAKTTTAKTTAKTTTKTTTPTKVAAAQSSSKTVSSIAIKKLPTKQTYKVGDTFSADGMTVKVTYSDGTSEVVSSGFTCSVSKLGTEGQQKVVVTYSGKTTGFYVTVK